MKWEIEKNDWAGSATQYSSTRDETRYVVLEQHGKFSTMVLYSTRHSTFEDFQEEMERSDQLSKLLRGMSINDALNFLETYSLLGGHLNDRACTGRSLLVGLYR